MDAWFTHDDVNKLYNGHYTHHEAVDYLPSLRGFGEVEDLHIAMSENQDLLQLVFDFALGWDFDAFADPSTFDSDVADILFEWAGVTAVSPTSRTDVFDSRGLEFLEEYFAEEFLQWGTNPYPWAQAAAVLERSWKQLKAHLAVQAGASALYGTSVTYDPAAGELSGTFDLSQSAIGDLVAFATAVGVDAEDYWLQVADFIEHTKGIANVTGTEEGWLDTAIYDSGLTTQTWDDLVDIYEGLDTAGITITGTTGDDTINGSAGDDDLRGSGGVTSGGYDEI